MQISVQSGQIGLDWNWPTETELGKKLGLVPKVQIWFSRFGLAYLVIWLS